MEKTLKKSPEKKRFNRKSKKNNSRVLAPGIFQSNYREIYQAVSKIWVGEDGRTNGRTDNPEI
jgi:hypothetical protein